MAKQDIKAVYVGDRIAFDNPSGRVAVIEADLVGKVDGPRYVSMKGPAEEGELIKHQTYRFFGRWGTYRNRRTQQSEKQFVFDTFTIAAPQEQRGIVEYLKEAGKGNGVGAAKANKLWQALGSNAIEICRENPQAIVDITSVRIDQAIAMSDWLTDRQKIEECTVDLMDLLAGRGFPKATARAAINEFGNQAAEVIRRDPYTLMNYRGCGFRLCDALWLDLGKDPLKLRRQAFSLWYAIASNSSGDTWFPVEYAFTTLRNAIPGCDLEKALKMALRIGKLRENSEHDHGAVSMCVTNGKDGPISCLGQTRWIAEGKKAAAEAKVASLIVDSLREVPSWPDIDEVERIDAHQRGHLCEATGGKVCLLGGSPGTGKTFTAAAMIRACINQFGLDKIAVGCPTGKAAVRITEALHENGISLRARTWHSLLGVEQTSERGGWKFAHDESKPLPFDLLIGDEESMKDTNLFCSVLRARGKAHMLLVGDVNQLPPVGHGAPLRDLINAGLPYGELREIKRNSGGIVEACAAIRDEQPWQPGDNLIVREEYSPGDQIEAIKDELRKAASEGLDPVWDCQVLVPVNKKSPLSRKSLNDLLQQHLNFGDTTKGIKFRIGDKVVNTKNGFFSVALPDEYFGDAYDPDEEEAEPNERGEVYVANGELGEVVNITPSSAVIVKLNSPQRVIRVFGKANASDSNGDDDKPAVGSWDLGYALSVHKFQGSEVPVAIVAIDEYPGARAVCDRSWLYTGISRAKQRCVLVGQKATADRFCRRTAVHTRKTFLRERILLTQNERVLAEI